MRWVTAFFRGDSATSAYCYKAFCLFTLAYRRLLHSLIIALCYCLVVGANINSFIYSWLFAFIWYLGGYGDGVGYISQLAVMYLLLFYQYTLSDSALGPASYARETRGDPYQGKLVKKIPADTSLREQPAFTGEVSALFKTKFSRIRFLNAVFHLTHVAMANHLTREQKLVLIRENLQEVLKPEIIENIVLNEDRPLKIYWGRQRHC